MCVSLSLPTLFLSLYDFSSHLTLTDPFQLLQTGASYASMGGVLEVMVRLLNAATTSASRSHSHNNSNSSNADMDVVTGSHNDEDADADADAEEEEDKNAQLGYLQSIGT